MRSARERRSAGERRPARLHWRTSFGPLARPLLPLEEGAAHLGKRVAGGYELSLARPHLFAWVAAELGESPLRDQRIRAEFDAPAGDRSNCAGGLILRYSDDRHFYYCLVAADGRVRFDVVFNGSPRPLLDWTRVASMASSPEAEQRPAAAVSLEVVAADTRFVIVVNDEWAATLEDDTLAAGGGGVAAQSYESSGLAPPGDRLRFRYRQFEFDRRPLAVSRWWLRWERAVPKRWQQRRHLAESFFATGHYGQAAAELARLAASGELQPEQRLMWARILAAQGSYPAALAQLEAAGGSGDTDYQREVRVEHANVLYASNEFALARGVILGLVDERAAPELWNLLGNVQFAMGDFAAAASAYQHAVAAAPQFPLFRRNCARALEASGAIDTAIEEYTAAGRLLLQLEALDELDLVTDALQRLASTAANGAPAGRAILALRGGRAFVVGDFVGAERAFGEFLGASPGAADDLTEGVVAFLYGLSLLQRGKRQDAVEHLRAAVVADPANPIYQLRLAETLYRLGEPYAAELERAAVLAPDDAFCLNLRAVAAMEMGDEQLAADFIGRARRMEPNDADLLINHAELLFRTGATAEALRLLEEAPTESAAVATWRADGRAVAAARIAQQRASLLSRLGRTDAASECYERALSLARDDVEILENTLAAAIAADRITRGEELLAKLLDARPDAATHNLAGNLAGLRGEYRRAEVAYREGIRLLHVDRTTTQPGVEELQGNLVAMFLQMEDYPRARSELDAMLATGTEPTARTTALLARLRGKYEQLLSCASCARGWWVPQQIPPQPSLRLRGEVPDDAPGGRCPECGRLYCVGCAQRHLQESRFVCASCDTPLSLHEDAVRYALRMALPETLPPASQPVQRSVL